MNTGKRIVANVLLVLVAVICTLLVGELGMRLGVAAWPFQPDPKVIPYLTEKDVNLLWRFSAQDGRNSLGLRNREIVDKEEDVLRILFLGDSLVWGSETSSGKLYTEVVEDNLNNVLNIDKRIEVINAGIPGYTTYQELEFLNVYGLDMQPDFVVLGFVFNDVYYKYLHRPSKDKIIGPEPESILHRFDVRSFPGTLFRRSYLAHVLMYVFQRIASKLGLSPRYSFDRRADFYLAWKSYGWIKAEALIGEMHEQLSEKGIPLFIVAFPIRSQLDDEYLSKNREYVLYPQSRIRKISEQYGIPYMDLTDALYRGGGEELFSDYLHLTEKGNDIVAAELMEFLPGNLPF